MHLTQKDWIASAQERLAMTGEVSAVLSPSLRANGSRECAPDDRLREAIQEPLKYALVSSTRVGRTSPALGRPDDRLRPVQNSQSRAPSVRLPTTIPQRPVAVGIVVVSTGLAGLPSACCDGGSRARAMLIRQASRDTAVVPSLHSTLAGVASETSAGAGVAGGGGAGAAPC